MYLYDAVTLLNRTSCQENVDIIFWNRPSRQRILRGTVAHQYLRHKQISGPCINARIGRKSGRGIKLLYGNAGNAFSERWPKGIPDFYFHARSGTPGMS